MTQDTKVEPPRPEPDELTQPFWDGCREHKLMIQRCQDCSTYIHYPRPVCSNCLSTNLAMEEVSGKGTLYSYTVVVQPFHPYYADKVPYLLGTIELDEQPKLMFFTRLTGCTEDDVKIGMPMHVTFEEAADDLTFALFQPAK